LAALEHAALAGTVTWPRLTRGHLFSELRADYASQSWRLAVPPLLHGGVIHLLANASWQLTTGVVLARAWGAPRVAFVFFVAALVGTMVSVLVRSREVVLVGSSGGVCGHGLHAQRGR